MGQPQLKTAADHTPQRLKHFGFRQGPECCACGALSCAIQQRVDRSPRRLIRGLHRAVAERCRRPCACCLAAPGPLPATASAFSRQISASIDSGIGDRQAPSRPAKHIFPLINRDLESTLDPFMSRTQSADTTTQHSNPIRHGEYFIAVRRRGWMGGVPVQRRHTQFDP
jgi:hypothetical protein